LKSRKDDMSDVAEKILTVKDAITFIEANAG
jgi:hypothetical protein